MMLMLKSGSARADFEADAFARDILPILQTECFKCHGEGRQRGNLRLDAREHLLRGGDSGPAVNLDAPGNSLLLEAVSYANADLQMPPSGPLPDESVARLRAWVLAGAPWAGAAERAPDPEAPSPPGGVTPPASVTTGVTTGAAVDFRREVLPVLSNHCFECHGPDPSHRKAGLRLDDPAAATGKLPSGSTAIVPGAPEASELVARITSDDPDFRMPPAGFEKPLTPEQADMLTRWVAQGAEYRAHWAFEPPARPEPPAAAEGWARNPIDRFVAARLEQEGLSPSPEADRRTLARRLTLDLTGLPATPEEVEAFAADNRPDAYERLVDRLLETTRHAEHRARLWLDAARYADTNGYHIDNERFMWRWRDWVIAAFARNMPYDQFTIEQLAGDLIPDATAQQRIASGFNRNHMINFEGGIIPEEYRVQYVLDRVDTTATVWMGLTMKCAQCHDHKYDPISQREFFEFYAFFNTIEEQGSDGNTGNAAPMMRAPTPEEERRLARVRRYLEGLTALYEAPEPDIDAAQSHWEGRERERLARAWRVLAPSEYASSGGAALTPEDGGALHVSGENPGTDTYEVIYTVTSGEMTALRLEALAQPEAAHGGPGRAENGNFVLTGVSVAVAGPDAPEDFQRVKLAEALADHAQPDFPVSSAIDMDPKSGWAVGVGSDGAPAREDRMALFLPESPVVLAEGARVRVRLRFESDYAGHAIGRFRVSAGIDPAWTPAKFGEWHVSGPYVAENGDAAYDTAFAPEEGVDLRAVSEDQRLRWTRARLSLPDGEVNTLADAVGATYLYRTVFAPTPRDLTLSLGSNDALRVWVNGEEVLSQRLQREAAPDQDRVRVKLARGENSVLLKVVNYGNAASFYFRKAEEQTGTLPPRVLAALTRDSGSRSEADTAVLRAHYRRAFSPEHRKLDAQAAEWRGELERIEAEIPTTMVMAEMAEPRETFVLERGQYDQPGERVEPATPAVLPPLPGDAHANRLTLAQWLVSPEHPLTARVTVNRLWQQFFGTGIVKTAEDFGVQGAWPSHPELLDWLAVEFVDSGWDLRHVERLLVTSAVYRQDSRTRPELLERDPENRLLARGPRFRLDAEVIRDQALAVSGLLVERTGGPSVRPFQPAGIWEEVSYGAGYSAQTFEQDTGDALYSRSMYTFWKRQAPPPNMMVFDAPNRETCTVRHERTNTPLQALTLMNDPQFVEAARALAERMLREGGQSPEERVAHAFLLATARPPAPEESRVLLRLLEENLAEFQADAGAAAALLDVGDFPRDPALPAPELAAYTTVANLILNLDETITKR